MKAEEHQSYAFVGAPAHPRQAGPGFASTQGWTGQGSIHPHMQQVVAPQYGQDQLMMEPDAYSQQQVDGQSWVASQSQNNGAYVPQAMSYQPQQTQGWGSNESPVFHPAPNQLGMSPYYQLPSEAFTQNDPVQDSAGYFVNDQVFPGDEHLYQHEYSQDDNGTFQFNGF